MSIRLTLPLPPSANRYWRLWNNRMVISAEARAYKEQVGWLCHEAGVAPLDGLVSVTYKVYRARKAGDLDNFGKCLFDSLIGHVYHDDSQIIEIHAYRFDDKANPRLEVEIEVVG